MNIYNRALTKCIPVRARNNMQIRVFFFYGKGEEHLLSKLIISRIFSNRETSGLEEKGERRRVCIGIRRILPRKAMKADLICQPRRYVEHFIRNSGSFATAKLATEMAIDKLWITVAAGFRFPRAGATGHVNFSPVSWEFASVLR